MAFDADTLHGRIREASGWYLGGGIVFVIVGILAILLPMVATLAIEIMIGVLFVIGGVYELIRAFRHRGAGRVIGAALFGLLALAAGVVLLAFPLEGAITLTLFLGVFFLVSGLFRIVAAFDIRPARNWGWLLFNGVASAVIGVLILAGLPSAGAWVLGLLVGIDFLFFGATLIALAMAARKAA